MAAINPPIFQELCFINEYSPMVVPLKFCNKYGNNFSPQQLIKDGDNIYYRNKLKSLVNQNCNISQESPIDSMEIILNKKT